MWPFMTKIVSNYCLVKIIFQTIICLEKIYEYSNIVTAVLNSYALEDSNFHITLAKRTHWTVIGFPTSRDVVKSCMYKHLLNWD